ncbi:enoyl-CoA hydratase, partial [Burkholderia pseudomallei]|nr:enoyl-CoA hydratase [Burkholderia pseudomallei]
GPRALGVAKALIGLARQGVPRGAALALERERFVDLFDGGEPREGVAAFLGKRKPQWRSDEGGQPR